MPRGLFIDRRHGHLVRSLFRVEQLLRPIPSRIVVAPRPRPFANKPKSQGSVPYLRQWGEPLAAARPHDLGGCRLTPERTSVCFAVVPEINAPNMPRRGRNPLNKPS